MNDKARKQALKAQENEITEHLIYAKLSKIIKGDKNRKVLAHISGDELRHYQFWKKITGVDVAPNKLQIAKYVFFARTLGLTFAVKLMERGEKSAQVNYGCMEKSVPGLCNIHKDEEAHEHKLIEMIDEEKLQYVGSIVLGLNDALVELTGALAGFTLALGNSRLIAVTGLIMGIAASLSMAASEYLSTKSEGGKNAGKSAVYCGIAYLFTVLLLITPFLLLTVPILSMIITMTMAVSIILFFTFYTSIAQDLPFGSRFAQMAAISIGVAIISFGIGFLVNRYLGVSI